MNPSRSDQVSRVAPLRPSGKGLDLFLAALAPLAAGVYLLALFPSGLPEALGLIVTFVAPAWAAVWLCAVSPVLGRRPGNGSAGAGIEAEPGARAGAEWLRLLPRRRQRAALLAGLVPLLVWPGLCALAGSTVWLGVDRLRSLLLVCLLSAIFSAITMFHRTRRSLAPTRSEVAGPVSGAAGFVKRACGGSFAARLPILAVLPAVAAGWLVMDATDHAQRARAEERALGWLAALADAHAASGGAAMGSTAMGSTATGSRESTGASVLEAAGSAPVRAPVPVEIFTVAPDSTGQGRLGPEAGSRAFRGALDRQLAASLDSGLIAPAGGPDLGAFRRRADGTLWVVRADRRSLEASAAGLPFGVSIGISIGMALLAGMAGVLVARDLEGATASLRSEAEQLAAGQPEAAPVEVGDDELARLSGAMRALGASLREALASREQAATRVEDQVARLSVALAGIAEASSVQQSEIDRVDLLMGSVQSQLDEASRSALELVTAMDASGHSVDQLGATGVELNETAALLTSRVDAVSASLEQMVESVRQVGSTTERLAEASDETSSSMEEMASAMRAVDTAAETTAKLSRDVVARAELGQAKVVQTIAGMEDIREATEAAERVIRGLGARTSEIGGILDVIEDVADETNLLALNAAIIAAQAGEQGKAFSVVAEEIKELADRVLASTKEIGGLIGAVQQESENAIGAIEAGSNRVMDGVDLAAEAGRTLEEITAASRESGDRIGEIVGAVREQTKAASHVVALMERVRESADRIGEATAEQDRGNDVVHRSAQTMREVAEQVRRTTEAQSAGFERIRANVADVRGSADRITRFLQDQAEACTQVTGFLASVAEGSRSNEACVGEVRGAMDGLRAEVQRLRAEVEGVDSRME